MLVDVGGQDATEAFEDVGHSDEAREVLEGLLIGNLKRQVSLSICYLCPCCRLWISRKFWPIRGRLLSACGRRRRSWR